MQAHFLGLAAGMSGKSMNALARRLERGVQLTLFLDTNVLFSVLDLHDNPANDAAAELMTLLARLDSKIEWELYVSPLTIDEAIRTLSAYESSLSNTYLTPALGRAAIASGSKVGGIVMRYLRAVSESDGRINARDFLSPYLTNLEVILRSKGIRVYTSDTQALTMQQAVIDDIVDVQEVEATRNPDRAKSYEAIRHDVALWHLAKHRRGTGLSSPLDARYWVVTIDYRYLAFDGMKQRKAGEPLQVCVHPAVLMQMLQLWTPRDEEFDHALFQGVRSMLPVSFDSAAEQTTLRILSTMARFERVDDIPEDTVVGILLNDAVRTRIAGAESINEEVTLIRDAITQKITEARRLAEEADERRRQSERELLELRASRDQALTDLQAEVERRDLALKEVGHKLAHSGVERGALENKIGVLETSLSDFRGERDREIADRRARMQWLLFSIAAIVAMGVVCVSGMFAPRFVSSVPYLHGKWAVVFGWSLGFGMGGIVLRQAGRALTAVRTSSGFKRTMRAIRWLVITAWTLALGLAGSYLYDYFRR